MSDSGIVGYRGTSPGGNEWFNHMPAEAIKARIGHEIWDSYFKFCVVRNPFEKLVSAFHFFEFGSHASSIEEDVIDRFSDLGCLVKCAKHRRQG